MTHRLYWEDPELFDFEATVVEVVDRGGRTALVLDRTAFFPEGGGQPCDLGTIDGVAVSDVQEEGEAILHFTDGGPFDAGQAVAGKVDAGRRRDHSVQHTAQHIVSALALELFGARTVGFHMGPDYVTIDLETPDLTREQRATLEEEANRAVAADLTVGAEVAVIEEGMELRVRKPPTPGVERRLVSVGDLDRCQCCGTHVVSSARIGAIKLGKVERVRKKARLEIIAGRRVALRLGRHMEVIERLSAMTSAGIDELGDHIAAAQVTAKELKRRNSELIARLSRYEARELVDNGGEIDGRRVVAVRLEDRDPAGLKALAAALTSHEGVVALLGSVREGRPALVFARSADVDVDVSTLAKEAFAILGGKGGGRPQLAQGGGGDPDKLDAALESAEHLLR